MSACPIGRYPSLWTIRGAIYPPQCFEQRAATAECSNAQFRNRDLTRLLVCGTEKVKAIALWHALTRNMTGIWALQPA